MHKIQILDLPPPLYTLKNSRKNHSDPILFSGYAKSIISQHFKDVDVEIIEQNISDLAGDAFILNKLINDSCEKKVIVFPTVTAYNYSRLKYIAKKLIEANNDTRIIISGSEVTPKNKDLKEFEFNFAETNIFSPEILTKLIYSLLSGDSIIETGLHKYNDNKVIFKGSSYPLRDIASPYLKGYLNSCFDYKIALLGAKAGCFGKCSYCCGRNFDISPDSFKKHKDIKDELMLMIDKGIEYIRWWDFTFNYPNNWFEDILNLILSVNKDKKLKFQANIRTDFLTREGIELLKKCNFNLLVTGLESISNTTLKKMDRPASLKRWLNTVKLLKKAGISIKVDVILGLLYDNLNTFKETIDFLVEEELISMAEIFVLRIEPSTLLPDLAFKEKAVYQKEAPHFLLNSKNFSFDDIKEGINYAQNMGAEIFLQSFQSDYFPLFTTFFSDGKDGCHISNPTQPVTKVIIDLDAEITQKNEFCNFIDNIKEKLARSVTVWFKCKKPSSKIRIIKNILNSFSKANPNIIWSIILDCDFWDEALSVLDEVTESIYFLPNYLDFESIFIKDGFNGDYYRNSTRFYILLSRISDLNIEDLKKINEKTKILWNVSCDFLNEKPLEIPGDGLVYEFPPNINEDTAIKIMRNINMKNWKKKEIFFKNLYFQTIYDFTFLNKWELTGYEEKISRIDEKGIRDICFHENQVLRKFTQIPRIQNS